MGFKTATESSWDILASSTTTPAVLERNRMTNMTTTTQPHTSGAPQPHTRAVRLPEVMQITQRSKTMIYADIRDGRFPVGFLIGKRARAWFLHEVMDWLESRKVLGG